MARPTRCLAQELPFWEGGYLGGSVLVAGGANFEGSVARRTASCLRFVYVTPPGLGEGRGILIPGLRSGAFAPPLGHETLRPLSGGSNLVGNSPPLEGMERWVAANRQGPLQRLRLLPRRGFSQYPRRRF